MADNKTQNPSAAENDTLAEIAELRQDIRDLISDRDGLRDEVQAISDRLSVVEHPTGGGTSDRSTFVALGAAVDREVGKLQRALGWIRDQSFPRLNLESPEPVVVSDAKPAAPVSDGSSTVGGTSQPSGPGVAADPNAPAAPTSAI